MVEAGLDRLAGKAAPQNAGLSEHARKRPRARRLRRERLRTQGRRAERPTHTALAGNRESFGKSLRNVPRSLRHAFSPVRRTGGLGTRGKWTQAHQLRRKRAFQRPSPPLSRALRFSPVLPPRSFVFAPRGPLPAADFCRRIFPHTGGFPRANAERRKRAEGSLLPPFRVCHCQTADAVRSTRVLWIISPERPLPPPLQRLR